MSKKIIVFLITLLSILTIGVVVMLIFLLSGKFNISLFSRTSEKLVFEKVYENNYKDIRIKADSANIYVKESENNSFKLLVYNDDNREPIVKDGEEILDIDSNEKKCNGFCFNRKITKLELYVPSNYEGHLNIVNDAGNVKIEADEISTLDVDMDAGNFNAKTIKTANVKTDAGNIKIENISNKCDLNTDAGNITIDSIDIKENSTIKTDVGNVKIGRTNEIYIDTKTDVGKVTINNNERKSEITLKITTDVGNIKVKN